jgi:mono/diheme cytochrome c family protein
MKNLLVSAAACAAVLFATTAVSAAGTASDAAAGKTTFAANCVACHQPGAGPYAGKTPDQITKAIEGIEGGSVNHPKKITLGAADIANVAAYVSPVGK